MKIDLYQIDAFASEPFRGNPAAVCPLAAWIDDGLMQSIALENNLSETAFFVDPGGGEDAVVALRWFTPTAEIELCGHATLATGYVILELLGERDRAVRFSTLGGDLAVRRDGERLLLDLPARPAEPARAPAALVEGLGAEPREVLAAAKNYLVVLDDEAAVRALAPDMTRLATLHPHGVIVTAPGDAHDFVSRYFAPSWGVPEDPATGSAHCTLAPYWAARLAKRELRAYQASRRGAVIDCVDGGERVTLGGRCVRYLQGTIEV